ncbi:hypothetical protein A3SI_00535 [Nitritalea halalkaliphila LW7]|uniref:Uncharacterized protein n=1 Tax=Nitritalea halalkaliphila LW7 TaxID=1189621 RepID=I5CAQ1_9BACT|nr:hypothetical protein [Nitritalea halalkaliphila]EIM78903.1 hypothetical protein A3SI_00535 [Nitritalea halalkaliphila LW7]
MQPHHLVDWLQEKEKRIEEKIDQLIEQNLNPFPFERINKGKRLLQLIHECRQYIQQDEFILAGKVLHALELEGLKVNVPESPKNAGFNPKQPRPIP